MGTSDRRVAPHFAGWQEYYRSRLLSATEAAELVTSGARVVFAQDWHPVLLADAVLGRADTLSDVVLSGISLQAQSPWLQSPAVDSFRFIASQPPAGSEHLSVRFDSYPAMVLTSSKLATERAPNNRGCDVYMLVVAPPDENGFCSLGRSNPGKSGEIRRASTVIAEVADHLQTRVRLHGDGVVHVSQIDYFVENPRPEPERAGDMFWKRLGEPDERARTIAGYVAELIRDGDVLEVGMGRNSEAVFRPGVLHDKRDLAIHSGQAVAGVVDLVRQGVITGERRTYVRGTAVLASAITESGEDELAFVDNNPAFRLQTMELINDPRVIAQNDNFVAINGVLAVDLNGQITSESIGTRTLGIAGGAPGFVLGALLSRGGRSISVCPSTGVGQNGEQVSRIMTQFPDGTRVTLPSYLADIVVSEFGVAQLMGKSLTERAKELIAIAHPDFRSELQRSASG